MEHASEMFIVIGSHAKDKKSSKNKCMVNTDILRERIGKIHDIFSFSETSCKTCGAISYKTFGAHCYKCISHHEYFQTYNNIKNILFDKKDDIVCSRDILDKICSDYMCDTQEVENISNKLIIVLKQRIFFELVISASKKKKMSGAPKYHFVYVHIF